MAASSAATQTTPGASARNIAGSGPTPSGNRLTTMAKNTSGVNTSVTRRSATVRSRRNTHSAAWARLALFMNRV